MPPVERLVDQFLMLWRILRGASHPVRRGEITPEQYWLLRVMGRRGPVRVGELAEALALSQSSVTIACKRLERDGLVVRERHPHDERAVWVRLTERGQERLEAWRQERRRTLAALLARLSEAEQRELERLLDMVLEHAEEHGAKRPGDG